MPPIYHFRRRRGRARKRGENVGRDMGWRDGGMESRRSGELQLNLNAEAEKHDGNVSWEKTKWPTESLL